MSTKPYYIFLPRVFSFTDLQVQGKPCWPGQWPTTQSVLLSECLAQSWCRSLLVKAQGWSENCLSWLGVDLIYYWTDP